MSKQEKVRLWQELAEKVEQFRRECMIEFARRSGNGKTTEDVPYASDKEA